MNTLTVEMRNCRGIKSLVYEFSFKKSNINIVYAPNGTMKTSFSRAFSAYAKNTVDEVADVFQHSGNPCVRISYDVCHDLPREAIFVASGDDVGDASQCVTNFLADTETKVKYDASINRVRTAYLLLIKKLEAVSHVKRVEEQLRLAFGMDGEWYEILSSKISDVQLAGNAIDIDYAVFFDDRGQVRKAVIEYGKLVEDYAKNYERLLNGSPLFGVCEGGAFGVAEVERLQDALSDGSYFRSGNELLFRSGKKYDSNRSLKEDVEIEVDRICLASQNSAELIALSRKLSETKGLDKFRKALSRSPQIASKLLNYDAFRQEVWLRFLHAAFAEYETFVAAYKEARHLMVEYANISRAQEEKWQRALHIYKSRFRPPFDIKIEKISSVLDKTESLRVLFKHEDGDKYLSTEEIAPILSRGEVRALGVLQVLFELENRSTCEGEQLVVLDDIVDSFDYRNKYAMVEYLHDVAMVKRIHVIVLTHNFDFYRLLSTRIHLGGTGNMSALRAERRSDKISLAKGRYHKNVFEEWLCKEKPKPEILFAMIPFVRNIVELTEGKGSDDFKKMTRCLHWKTQTGTARSIKCKEIAAIYNRVLGQRRTEKDFYVKCFASLDSSYISALFDVADRFGKRGGDAALEYKIIFAIAIRLRAEQYLHGVMKDCKLHQCQFGSLVERYRHSNGCQVDRLDVLTRIGIVAPEYIHLNAFMYESLIDTGMDELRDLYATVRNW